MRMPLFAVVLFLSVATALAQAPGQWKDSSPHRVRFVEIEDGVRLETLDWDGTGRSLLLLVGGSERRGLPQF